MVQDIFILTLKFIHIHVGIPRNDTVCFFEIINFNKVSQLHVDFMEYRLLDIHFVSRHLLAVFADRAVSGKFGFPFRPFLQYPRPPRSL